MGWWWWERRVCGGGGEGKCVCVGREEGESGVLVGYAYDAADDDDEHYDLGHCLE